MPANSEDPQDKDLDIYIYDKDEDAVVSNVKAIFVYEDKLTSIFWKPDTIHAFLKQYVDRIHSGEITPTAWQQFVYLIHGSFPPNHRIFEQSDKIRTEVAQILHGWEYQSECGEGSVAPVDTP